MKLLGKVVLAAMLLVMAVFLSDKAGAALLQVLERSEQILYEYSSEGQFDYNVYLSGEVNAQTGILDEIRASLGSEESDGLIGLCEQIDRYQMELLPMFLKNGAYLDYLWEQGTGLTGLFEFCKNLSELADNLNGICRYLLFFIWVTILHFLMKCRPLFYFGMGLMCIFATSLRLSNQLLAGYFSDGNAVFHLISEDLVPAMLEAMLTFLIFDITFAALEQQRISKRLAPIYADLSSLAFLIIFLSQFADLETQYRPSLGALLPHIMESAKQPPRGKKAKRFQAAIRALEGPHSNRTLLHDLVMLSTLIPPP